MSYGSVGTVHHCPVSAIPCPAGTWPACRCCRCSPVMVRLHRRGHRPGRAASRASVGWRSVTFIPYGSLVICSRVTGACPGPVRQRAASADCSRPEPDTDTRVSAADTASPGPAGPPLRAVGQRPCNGRCARLNRQNTTDRPTSGPSPSRHRQWTAGTGLWHTAVTGTTGDVTFQHITPCLEANEYTSK